MKVATLDRYQEAEFLSPSLNCEAPDDGVKRAARR
jgi:hypothetical protein